MQEYCCTCTTVHAIYYNTPKYSLHRIAQHINCRSHPPRLMYRVTVRTAVRAPQPAVWEHASSMRGVNYELWPLFRMSCPDMDMKISEELVGVPIRPLFRSWLFLFGVFPVDYDDINLASVIEGKSFSERSSMLLMPSWHHDRILESNNDGTVVTDALAFVPRFHLMGYLLSYVVKYLFLHRHNRLISQFGCCCSTFCELKFE